MKFDYNIHITRSGDKTYAVQVRDGGAERPGVSKPVAGLDWNTLWATIPRAIQQRENKKIEEYKKAIAKVPEPKDWVPTAPGQPAIAGPAVSPATPPAPLPKLPPEPPPPPMPEITQVPKRGPGRPPKQAAV